VKVGDLVKWVMPGMDPVDRGQHTGIIVNGPRDGCQGDEKVSSYEVAWFTEETWLDGMQGWHTDYNLELLSESR
jgi:hypothetical protein